MKILIAPDSFKGSLTAPQAAAAMADGCLAVIPSAHIISLPLADGGEGTVRAMVEAARGISKSFHVTGPLGTVIEANFALLPDGVIVIESAAAHGLLQVPEALRNPLKTTSYGTGELIRYALSGGSERILIGLGGTATNDGGLGCLQALGARLIDRNRKELPHPATGTTLLEIADIDVSEIDPALDTAIITIASDVTNPLFGPSGASVTFGAQKGATPAMVSELDMAMVRWSKIMTVATGRDVSTVPGAGAAGGLGAALIAFAKGTVRPGIDVVLDAISFDDHLNDADLVLTGEGSIDGQTLFGKALFGIFKRSVSKGVPLIAFGGNVDPAVALNLINAGFYDVRQIAPSTVPIADRIAKASQYLRNSSLMAVSAFNNRK